MINLLAVLLVLIATFIGGIGALLLKKAADKYAFKKMLFSSLFWSGLFLYGLSSVFYILALKREQLSVVYPLVSTSYIWTVVFSVKFLKEKMNKWKYLVLVGIILGIVLIGMGS
ncbi:MAG: EamA family transporter [Nanoarchaeota archaeon]